MLPEWLSNLPRVCDAQNVRDTRQRNDLYIPRTNTNIGRNSLRIAGPYCWNKLTNNVKGVDNLTKFKKKLKEYILEKKFIYYMCYFLYNVNILFYVLLILRNYYIEIITRLCKVDFTHCFNV